MPPHGVITMKNYPFGMPASAILSMFARDLLRTMLRMVGLVPLVDLQLAQLECAMAQRQAQEAAKAPPPALPKPRKRKAKAGAAV